MEHQAFRILGLDTSFTRDEEKQATDTPNHSRKHPQAMRLAPETTGRAPVEEARVTVRLVELLPLLMEAAQKDRAWIKDFRDDHVTISQDLYEVALAYRSLGRVA